MKNTIIKILLLLLLSTNISCENDGGDSKLEASYGAVLDIKKTAATDSFINLEALQSGNEINLGVTINKALGEFTSINVVGYYTDTSGKVSKGVLESNIKSLPFSSNFNKEDLFLAFDNLNSISDFKIGDKLILSTEITLPNGTKVSIVNNDGTSNVGSNITSSGTYEVTQTYNVSCPSDLAGTYSVVSSGKSTDSKPSPSINPITKHPYIVTITAIGGGEYTISDAFAGLYLLWYDIYGVKSDYEGKFYDVCGVISGSFPEPLQTTVTITGKVNANGTLNIGWKNGYDDFGDGVYTKIK